MPADGAAKLQPGAQIVAGPAPTLPGKSLGHITSAAHSATLGHSVALALVSGGMTRKGWRSTPPAVRAARRCRCAWSIRFSSIRRGSASMAERRSALAECLKPGVYGAAVPGGPGIGIRELRPLAVVQVAAFDAERASAAVGAALGVPAPPGRNAVATAGDSTVLWTGPGRWLVIEPGRQRILLAQLSRRCRDHRSQPRAHGARIEGPQVRGLLAKLCTLDLDPAAFPPGTCAQTQFGQIGVLLYCRAEHGFDIFVLRGFAVSALETVFDAALEFGCRVT